MDRPENEESQSIFEAQICIQSIGLEITAGARSLWWHNEMEFFCEGIGQNTVNHKKVAVLVEIHQEPN